MFAVRPVVAWGMAVVALGASAVTEVAAQQQPAEALIPTTVASQPEGRFFISLDGGGQGGSQQLQDRAVTGQIFGEDQVVDSDYNIDRSSGAFRGNVSTLLYGNLGVGFGFTRTASTGEVDVTVAVPHPIFTNRPRTATDVLRSVGHRENMYHFQAVWIVALDERAQVQIFGGPTLMSVDQAIVDGAVTTEVGSPFTQINLADVTFVEQTNDGLGFHVGLDFAYMLGDSYGIGGFVQYAGGSMDFDLGQGPTSITVGGIQFGGGLRLRF